MWKKLDVKFTGKMHNNTTGQQKTLINNKKPTYLELRIKTVCYES